MRIAYLTGRSFRGQKTPAHELPGYEAPDFALVCAEGRDVGIAFEPVYWDDESLPQQGFDAALVRSCWDYTGQAERFLAIMQAHEAAGLKLLNPARVLAWNARKGYLRELAQAGLPIIETVWAERVDARVAARAFEDLDAAELVVKPQVGAGSQATLRLKRNQWSEADLIAGPQGAAMLQPFLPSIETEGELSLLYFGGVLSHTIRKLPPEGAWFANDLKARFSAMATPPPGTEAIAARAVAAAERATGAQLLYARADLVLAAPGDWRLIELELIEPYLFLALAEGAAANLVFALAGRLRAGA